MYRKDKTLDGGGVMLLIDKDISHMPIAELENDSESVWVKVFANKTSHFVASCIRITCPCNEHPLKPHFYIEKVGFTRVYIFFLFLLQNIDCGYSLEPPR